MFKINHDIDKMEDNIQDCFQKAEILRNIVMKGVLW